MKIHELIEELRQFNQNAEVQVELQHEDEDGEEVFTDKAIGRIYPINPHLRPQVSTVTITLQ